MRNLLLPVAAVLFVALAPSTDAGIARVDGIAYVTKRMTLAPGGQLERSARCPAGARVLSGGVAIGGDSTDIEVGSSHPFDGGDRTRLPDDGWTASARSGPGDGSLTMVVHAICARMRVDYGRRSVALPPSEIVEARATCRGETAVGGGIKLRGGPGPALSIGWNSNLDTPRTEGWESAMHNRGGATRRAVVYAICVRPTVQTAGRSGTSAPGRDEHGMNCFGRGYRVIGGGLEARQVPGVELGASYPVDGGDPDRAADDSWRSALNNETESPQRFRASAYCIRR